MLAKVALEAGADFVTMDRVERERKIVYPITAAIYFTDHQKEVIYNKIREIYGHFICNELKPEQVRTFQGRL